jgi:hypothetical protein
MEQNIDNECPVCFGTLADVEPCCPNNHRICSVCLPHIRRANNRCPLCRARLNPPPMDAALLPPRNHADDIEAELNRIEAQHDAWAQLAPDAIGRVHRNPRWREARRWFLYKREHQQIPGDAQFGGIHLRNCGHRGCNRKGGMDGVRFLLGPNGKRRYRCEEHEHV